MYIQITCLGFGRRDAVAIAVGVCPLGGWRRQTARGAGVGRGGCDLFRPISEDDDTGRDDGVGQERAYGHKLDQVLKVEEQGD